MKAPSFLKKNENQNDEPAPLERHYTALVINSSQAMAKEITMQLTLNIPACSIMYAPTIELARWILKRRDIQLVVSSPLLPDGSVNKLIDTLAALKPSPDLVVVGNLDAYTTEVINKQGYEFATMRQIGKQHLRLIPKNTPSRISIPENKLKETISSLGADIRNDLNNPLQEIVAMVFVAQATDEIAAETTQALGAIEKAAQNMSAYVNKLENKIRQAVTSHSN